MKKALLVVDLQNDFYENGQLAVEGASTINPRVNQLLHSGDYQLIVASQDWHPPDHHSFASNHGLEPFTPYQDEGLGPVLWPEHCLQGSQGADFHPEIDTTCFNYILRKGTDPQIDSYSAFYDNDGTDLGLSSLLKGLNIETVDICGLALDVCVKHTALDAVNEGFNVNLIKEASKAVNNQPPELQQTLTELKQAGVNLI